MIQAHDNGGAADNHLPPDDGKIDWKQFSRDLIESDSMGAFVLCSGDSDGKARRAVGAICAMSQDGWALAM